MRLNVKLTDSDQMQAYSLFVRDFFRCIMGLQGLLSLTRHPKSHYRPVLVIDMNKKVKPFSTLGLNGLSESNPFGDRNLHAADPLFPIFCRKPGHRSCLRGTILLQSWGFA